MILNVIKMGLVVVLLFFLIELEQFYEIFPLAMRFCTFELKKSKKNPISQVQRATVLLIFHIVVVLSTTMWKSYGTLAPCAWEIGNFFDF